MIVRAAALYLLIFIVVLLALDAGAYVFMLREYHSLLGPALGTPEGDVALASAMRRVVVTIATLDVPLVLLVALASYLLARASMEPLVAARERERIFAGDAAHELRSPLTEIASVAQAARSNAEPQSREAFEEIARTAIDASAIVGDLLTLARDPARAVLQCEPVDLAAIVSGCARELTSRAQSKNVLILTDAKSAIVNADQRRLRELGRNLLENAIRYAKSEVTIASRQNGSACLLVVTDDGPGVPQEERERIFERFYRRNEDGTGTGLGLAIVRWIVTAHEGSVNVDSSDKGGARFVASLPKFSG